MHVFTTEYSTYLLGCIRHEREVAGEKMSAGRDGRPTCRGDRYRGYSESIRTMSKAAKKMIHKAVIESSTRSRVLMFNMSIFTSSAAAGRERKAANHPTNKKAPAARKYRTAGAFVAQIGPVNHEQGATNIVNAICRKSSLLWKLHRTTPAVWQQRTQPSCHAAHLAGQGTQYKGV